MENNENLCHFILVDNLYYETFYTKAKATLLVYCFYSQLAPKITIYLPFQFIYVTKQYYNMKLC